MNFEKHILYGWLVLFTSGYLLLKFTFGILISDDSYITLCHIKTWINHGTVVMSASNPVNATSTPLFSILLGILSSMVGTASLESLAYYCATAFEAASFVLVYKIARALDLPLPLSLMAVALYGFSGGLYPTSASGMETTLYIFCILALHYLILFKPSHTILTALTIVCVTMVRPEGIIAGIVASFLWYASTKNRRITLLYLMMAFFGLTCFFLFYYFSNGVFLPYSVIAKREQMHFTLYQAFQSWMEHAFYKGPVFGGKRSILSINGIAFMCGVYGLLVKKSGRKFLSLSLWVTLYIAFFIVTRASDPLMPWYFFPIVPFCILMVTGGIYACFPKYQNTPYLQWTALFLVSIFCFCNFFTQKIPSIHIQAHKNREERYMQAIEIMKSIPTESNSVLIDEVGVIGYFSPFKIYDIHGLISPEVIPLLKKWNRYDSIAKHIIQCSSPQWIITMRHKDYRNAAYSPNILSTNTQYRLHATIPSQSSPFILEIFIREERMN